MIFSALSFTAASASARAPTVIACIGDSITAGHGDSVPDGGTRLGPYPQQLEMILAQRFPGIQVKNFGVGGTTLLSSGNMPYIKQPEYTQASEFVANAGADAVVDVIIMLGTNDSKASNWDEGENAAEFSSDYDEFIDHFAKLPTKPSIYVMIPPAVFTNPIGAVGETLVDDIDPLIRKVATAEGASLIDLYGPTKGKPELFDQGVHPTDAGYTLIADVVAASILSTADDAGLIDAGKGEGDAGAEARRTGGCSTAGPSGGHDLAGALPALCALLLVAVRFRSRS